MSEHDTQTMRVLEYLTDHGEIDQGVTLRWDPPITRLAARIADLKAAGHPVDQVGKAGKFARYGFTNRVSPTKPGSTPPPRPKHACPVCTGALAGVEPTLSPALVRGKCLYHGWKLVEVVA